MCRLWVRQLGTELAIATVVARRTRGNVDVIVGATNTRSVAPNLGNESVGGEKPPSRPVCCGRSNSERRLTTGFGGAVHRRRGNGLPDGNLGSLSRQISFLCP